MRSKAAIVKKILFTVPVETITPLAIGAGKDDGLIDSLILKDKKGQAFIPATSLAGVLRAEIVDIYGEDTATMVFGGADDNDNQSMISIEDVMLANTTMIYRDGVRIDTFTGTAVKGAKFDFEALDRGATGVVKMEMTVRAIQQQQAETGTMHRYVHPTFAAHGDVFSDIAATLADILTRGIRLGSKTTKGFGQIQSQKPAEVHILNFEKAKAMTAWLDYLDGKKLVAPTYQGNAEVLQGVVAEDMIITLEAGIKSALIIRDFTKEADDDTIAARQLKSKGEFVIPGSSIKGVLRNRAFDILLLLMNRNREGAEAVTNRLMGFANESQKSGCKSRVAVNEVYITSDAVQPKVHARNRIDRFTGGTIEGALFKEEPLWQIDSAASPIHIEIRITRCSPSEAGLMLLVLKDIWLGNLPIGGNKGIGRGVLQGHKATIDYKGEQFSIEDMDTFTVAGNKETLESYVQALVGECNG